MVRWNLAEVQFSYSLNSLCGIENKLVPDYQDNILALITN